MLDLYRQVTDRIIAALAKGTPPWVRPWSAVIDTLPVNAASKRPYRGVNFILLSLEVQAQGYAMNRWLTYRQAAELGGQVRKGEQACPVVFWKLRKVDATGDTFPMSDEQDLPDRVIPLLRQFHVFNVAQIDGLPEAMLETSKQRWVPEAKAEELLLMSGARIRHGGAKAFYQPATDEIHIPPRAAFPSAPSYYATALHELTHWTAPPARCARQLGRRFGDDAYAAEEIIAEMGAAFLCARCGLDGKLEHASYVDHWLRMLRADHRAVFVAAGKAQQAADYIVSLTQPASASSLAA